MSSSSPDAAPVVVAARLAHQTHLVVSGNPYKKQDNPDIKAKAALLRRIGDTPNRLIYLLREEILKARETCGRSYIYATIKPDSDGDPSVDTYALRPYQSTHLPPLVAAQSDFVSQMNHPLPPDQAIVGLVLVDPEGRCITTSVASIKGLASVAVHP